MRHSHSRTDLVVGRKRRCGWPSVTKLFQATRKRGGRQLTRTPNIFFNFDTAQGGRGGVLFPQFSRFKLCRNIENCSCADCPITKLTPRGRLLPLSLFFRRFVDEDGRTLSPRPRNRLSSPLSASFPLFLPAPLPPPPLAPPPPPHHTGTP